MAPKAPAKKQPITAAAEKKKKSVHARVNLIFPVTRIKTYMKKSGLCKRTSVEAAIAVAAGIEYIVSELLSVTVEKTSDPKFAKSRITPRMLNLTIENDDELKALFAGSTIRGGGVNPTVFAPRVKKGDKAKKVGEPVK